jgi:hypothetical protein
VGVVIIPSHLAVITLNAMSGLTPQLPASALPDSFFDRDAQLLARELLGKVIRHRVGDIWLSARIIETEAYYVAEKAATPHSATQKSVRLCFWMAAISTCTTPVAAIR